MHQAPPHGAEPQPARLIAREIADRVVAIGLRRQWFGDLYHRILTVGWPSFLAGAFAVYIGANVVFAGLYLVQPGAIANAAPGSFFDAFFFSVETIATVGYGQMLPATLYANAVMTLEAAVGLLFAALITGLVFARFSRPTARITFSQVAVVHPYNGVPTLSIRLANERQNQLLAAEVSFTLLRDETSVEGETRRRFYDLTLLRDRSPVFALTFTVMHPIDEASPLHGLSSTELEAQNAELVVMAGGIDETLVQPVTARTSYLPHEIRWGHQFVDIFGWTEDGRRAIDYRRFHDTVAVTAAP
ncbi:MAG: ATP-sensitive inward rectifier potassium channel 10 [Alphaproteobacteria bacterium]|nr:ATP-sensitive inward rectifier potassium channel 10 [Alphaproteobacteria bacterium]